MFTTLEVSKFDKFNEVNERQSLNMLFIYDTCEVLKLDNSIELNE